MPRGDYRTTYKRDRVYMPVARDTAFVEKSVSEEKFTENWEHAFKVSSHRPELNQQCTCNFREEKDGDKTYFVSDECKYCGLKAQKKLLKLTDIEKKFSKHHMDKVREHVIYGNTDIREVINRN